MAYQESTPVSVSDILNIISTFAVGLGWTQARNNTFTSGGMTRRILSLSRSGFDHVHIFGNLNATDYDYIYTQRSVNINNALDAVSQPNKSKWSQTNLLSNGPYVKMYLFGEGGTNPYVHCVIEHAAGRYRHFGFGEIVKKGTWTGGGYAYGQLIYQQSNSSTPGVPTNFSHLQPFSTSVQSSTDFAYYNGGLRCDECDAATNGIAGIDDRYVDYNSQSSRKTGCGLVVQPGAIDFPYVQDSMGPQVVGRSDYNQRSHLIRLSHFVSRASNYHTYIGEPPALRAIDMTAFSATEELILGTDTWKIFPLTRKGDVPDGGSNNESSGAYALAYKKVA